MAAPMHRGTVREKFVNKRVRKVQWVKASEKQDLDKLWSERKETWSTSKCERT